MRTLLETIFGGAQHIDGPESWIAFCQKAADEASEATRIDNLPKRSSVSEAVEKLRSPLYAGFGLNNWEVQYCIRVADAYASGQLGEAVAPQQEAAAVAYRNCLPAITNRRSVQTFVACVAAGVACGYISAKEANTLLYAAQAALAAMPKRRAPRGRKAGAR